MVISYLVCLKKPEIFSYKAQWKSYILLVFKSKAQVLNAASPMVCSGRNLMFLGIIEFFIQALHKIINYAGIHKN